MAQPDNRISVRIQDTQVDAASFSNAMKKFPASRINYLIFFTPRSGSSWLADVLKKTRKLGAPVEWFNPNFAGRISKAINANTVSGYLDMLRRKKKTPNGVFGAELTFLQYKTVDQIDLFEALSPKCFYLRRRDIAAQAISLFKAVSTKRYHNTPDTPDDREEIDAGVEYDAAGIRKWVHHILHQEKMTERLFAERGVSPRRLYYEDVAGDAPKALSIFYRDILGEAPSKAETHVEEQHEPLGSSLNSRLKERFLRDESEYVEQVTAERPPLI